MLVEIFEEYALAFAEAAYKDTGQKIPMVFMDSGGDFQDVNASHLVDQKQP